MIPYTYILNSTGQAPHQDLVAEWKKLKAFLGEKMHILPMSCELNSGVIRGPDFNPYEFHRSMVQFADVIMIVAWDESPSEERAMVAEMALAYSRPLYIYQSISLLVASPILHGLAKQHGIDVRDVSNLPSLENKGTALGELISHDAYQVAIRRQRGAPDRKRALAGASSYSSEAVSALRQLQPQS